MLPKPSELRKLTAQAIERGQEEKRRTEQERLRKLEQEKVHDALIAEGVLAGVPDKCKRAAAEGKMGVVVMRVKHTRDYSESFTYKTIIENNLKGPALIVWDKLKASDLNPTIIYDHDGMGMDSWYDIWVNW